MLDVIVIGGERMEEVKKIKYLVLAIVLCQYECMEGEYSERIIYCKQVIGSLVRSMKIKVLECIYMK